MWRSWAMIAGLAALAPVTGEHARGQVVEAASAGPGVAVGERVRVGGVGRSWRVGSVTAVDTGGFDLSMEGGGDVWVPWSSATVERSVDRRSRAKGGALIGMVAGAAVLTAAALAEPSGSGAIASTGQAVGAALVLGGLAGGILGAFVGSTITADVWVPIEPGPRLTMQPTTLSVEDPRLALAWSLSW